MLRCTVCQQEKPASAYGPEKRKRNGLKSQCRDCCNRDSKRQYRKNRAKRLADDRTKRLKRYGLDEASLLAMYERQLGECAGCFRHMELDALKVDHCHRRGHTRGLLCHNCNITLGLIKDNPRTLENLARYLREH